MRLDVVACSHWHAGVCLRGHHGGRPSAGLCMRDRFGECEGAALTGGTIDVASPRQTNAAAFDGSAMWAELHRHAPGPATPAWLKSFAVRLPCGECRRHWLSLSDSIIWHLGQDVFFQCTVMAHNAVNLRLGKPEISLEEARARWL